MGELTEAAVLVPLRDAANGDNEVGFAVLSEDAPNHPGHVAFPGGRRDPEDRTLRETAFREANEEVGLNRSVIDSVQALPYHETRTSGFTVKPYVGRVPTGVDLDPDGWEVVDTFWVPINDLTGQFQDVATDGGRFPHEKYEITGLTARVLATVLVWTGRDPGPTQ